MGEALDYIDTIIQGMDVWMQRYSNAVAQQHINPSPQDYLIQEFPHFTDSMRRAFMELKLLYYAKGKAYQGFSVLDVARAHMLDSMKLVETELNAAVQKIEVSRVMNNNNKPMPDDGLDIDN
jgi:hypothetical protein